MGLLFLQTKMFMIGYRNGGAKPLNTPVMTAVTQHFPGRLTTKNLRGLTNGALTILIQIATSLFALVVIATGIGAKKHVQMVIVGQMETVTDARTGMEPSVEHVGGNQCDERAKEKEKHREKIMKKKCADQGDPWEKIKRLELIIWKVRNFTNVLDDSWRGNEVADELYDILDTGAQMKRYEVQEIVEAFARYTVEAESPDEARDMVSEFGLDRADYVDYDWDNSNMIVLEVG